MEEQIQNRNFDVRKVRDTLIKAIISVLRGEVSPHVSTIQRFEIDAIRIAKELGVEQEVFFKLKENIKDTPRKLPLFNLQTKIYERRIVPYLDFIRRIKDVGDFILIKGFGIAQKYYENLLRRHVGDIDILIPVDQRNQFVEFFHRIGMRRAKLSEIKKRFGHSEQFSDGKVSVGLHTYLCDRLFAEIRYEDVERQRTVLQFGDRSVEVWTLMGEWDLIELSLHAFQHAFAIRIILDIYKTISAHTDLRRAKSIAERFKVERMFSISVLSSVKVFAGDARLDEISDVIKPSAMEMLISDFLSSEFFLFKARNYLYKLPYTDKIFSLTISGRLPLKKLLTIAPYIPKEFIKRVKGYYDTTI